MSKKVLIISSSPVKDGNSDTLCQKFAEGAIEAGHQVEKIDLRNLKINHCRGCGYCSTTGYNGCCQKDDMAAVLDKLLDADVVVFGTPVYFYAMCGQMKTFIDRCCGKYTKIKDKEFYYIITAAESDAKMLNRTVEEFRGFLDCLEDCEEKGILCGTGVWKKGDVNNTKYPQQAFEIGKVV
ncbi:MAG: flavodoxin family protein [Synergistaceae bacterium]|nr:flavodoxin family protein [Synergistaceae bacterium]